MKLQCSCVVTKRLCMKLQCSCVVTGSLNEVTVFMCSYRVFV